LEDTILAKDKTPSVGERLEPIIDDVERLVDLHAELLQSELRQSAAQATSALANIAAGTGLAAVGGLLGSLALVHGLHRTTRLPLWGCYGLVGSFLGVAGGGLLESGIHQISGINFIPRETIATLREDLEWVKGKTK